MTPTVNADDKFLAIDQALTAAFAPAPNTVNSDDTDDTDGYVSDDYVFDEYEINLAEEYPEPKFLLMFAGVGTMPRGDIQSIKAKSKNGKSYLCSIFIASILGCKDFGCESQEAHPVVLYFDSEQNRRNTSILTRRVHTLLGYRTNATRRNFHTFSMRTMDIEQRLPYIQKRVDAFHPTAVFIDGIADLIYNFNDVEQSTKLVNDLMKLSADNDCCVCSVLHTNKAKDDNAMKGHLGTLSLQKSSDVFEVKKNGTTFTVEQTDSRNAPISDFAFTLTSTGKPIPTVTPKDAKEQLKVAALKQHLDDAFGEATGLRFTDLVNHYQARVGVGVTTAKNAVREAKDRGLVEVTHNDLYRRSYNAVGSQGHIYKYI